MDRLLEGRREVILQLAREHGVTCARVFGSMARGDAGTESDVDLLVDLEGRTLLDLGALLIELLVLTTRELEWNERGALTDALFDIEMAHGVVISPLIAPAAEWERGRFAVLPIHEAIEESEVLV